jgi:hypothetical protein
MNFPPRRPWPSAPYRRQLGPGGGQLLTPPREARGLLPHGRVVIARDRRVGALRIGLGVATGLIGGLALGAESQERKRIAALIGASSREQVAVDRVVEAAVAAHQGDLLSVDAHPAKGAVGIARLSHQSSLLQPSREGAKGGERIALARARALAHRSPGETDGL